MTLPDVFTAASTQAFLWEIFIFIEGGLIIGQFWYSHSRLFDQVTFISTSAVLFNILFLLVLSLIPLFTRAIMQHPDMTAPIIGFVITILITSVIFQLLHHAVYGKIQVSTIGSFESLVSYLLLHLVLSVSSLHKYPPFYLLFSQSLVGLFNSQTAVSLQNKKSQRKISLTSLYYFVILALTTRKEHNYEKPGCSRNTQTWRNH